MAGIVRTFDMLVCGATLQALAFGREAVDYGATVCCLEWTGHVGGTSCGGLGIGDWVTASKDRWGRIKAWGVYIGSHPPYNRTDGLEQQTFSSIEAKAATQAIFLDRPDMMTVVTNARIRDVFTDPISGAITAVWLQNDDLYLANHSAYDGSYELDMASRVVKCRNGLDSADEWDEPVEYPDKDGKLSIVGFNPNRYDPESARGYDSKGNRFLIVTQPGPVGMHTGSGMAISQSKGWRFDLMLDTPSGLPWVKPSGTMNGDIREVLDMLNKSGHPDGSGGGITGSSPFPFGGSAQAISGTAPGTPGRYSTNGCDLPGVYTNPWVTATYDQRVVIQEKAAFITMLSNWVTANHAEAPASKKATINRYSLPSDEFQDAGEYTLFKGFPPAFYVRDDIAIIGQYTMTAKNTMKIGGVDYSRQPDSISVGGYHIDVHTPLYFTRPDGRTQKTGGLGYSSDVNYQIPLRACLPPVSVCPNLSVSFGAAGTATFRAGLRMEFTTTCIAQAMGILHGIAFSTGRKVGSVPYSELRAALLARGAFL